MCDNPIHQKMDLSPSFSNIYLPTIFFCLLIFGVLRRISFKGFPEERIFLVPIMTNLRNFDPKRNICEIKTYLSSAEYKE